MSTDLQPPGHPLTELTPLDVVLGAAQGRYFGAGYRGVEYSLTGIEGAAGTLAGSGQVTYPRAWSTDGGGAERQPHLSSIDATLLPLALLEQTASPEMFARLGSLQITELRLSAGAAPFLALEAVPVHANVEEGVLSTTVRAEVGNIKVGLTLVGVRPVIDLRPASPLAAATTVYAHLFRRTVSTSWVREDHSGTRLLGQHVLAVDIGGRTQGGDLAEAPRGGVEGLSWPTPTMIDYLVIMGQLTQALVYTAAGRRRSDSGPLWMRTIHIRREGALHPLPARFDTSIELLRDRTLARNGATVHDCKVHASASTGVEAVATLAYEER